VQRHGEVAARVGLADMQDADDVRMAQRRGDPGLAPEPLREPGVAGGQDLESDRVAAPGGSGGEHPGEPAPAVHPLDGVPPELSAYQLLGVQGPASRTLQGSMGRLNFVSVIN
jgi:hypothetical protein